MEEGDRGAGWFRHLTRDQSLWKVYMEEAPDRDWAEAAMADWREAGPKSSNRPAQELAYTNRCFPAVLRSHSWSCLFPDEIINEGDVEIDFFCSRDQLIARVP